MKCKYLVLTALLVVWVFISNCFAADYADGPGPRNIFTAKVKGLFENGKYSELDAIADSLNKCQTLFIDGGYKLRSFTDAFELLVDGDQTYPDWVFSLYRENAEKWRKTNPRSVAARIALAQAWHGYAWKARGNGWAKEVKDSSRSVFHKRLDIAWQILKEPLAQGMTDSPERHVLLLRIANYRGENRTDFEKLFQEAARLYPDYYDIYSQKAEYLTQRWHGREGEWQDFIMDLARRNKGGHGATLYTRTAWSRSGEWSDFKRDGISWTVMKKGFQEIVREHPGSPYVLNVFAKFACIAKDNRTLGYLFKQMKPDQIYPDVWNRVSFDDCLNLAVSTKH